MEVPNQSDFSVENVAIIGLGLIGGSIAKDIRSHYPNAHISAIDNNQASLENAIDDGIVNRSISYEELGKTACFIILATPIDYIEETAHRVKNVLSGNSSHLFSKYIVIDTASVKTSISETFKEISTEKVQFVATHPMAGTEYAGWRHSRKELFRAKPWILCPHDANDPETLASVDQFIKKLGARSRTIDPVTHDQQAALVSHSVIMLSNILFDYVSTNHPDALDLAGDGFTSTTRLASGNPELHKSIITHNSEHTYSFLNEFNNHLKAKIKEHKTDEEGLLSFFKQNMVKRNRWLRRRG